MIPNEPLDLPKSYGVVTGSCSKIEEGGEGATSDIVKMMSVDLMSPAC